MLRHKVYWFLHVHNELIINILPLSHYFFYTEQKFMFKEIKNIATVHKLKVRRVAVCESFIKQQTSSSDESYPLLHVPSEKKGQFKAHTWSNNRLINDLVTKPNKNVLCDSCYVHSLGWYSYCWPTQVFCQHSK